MYYVTPSVTGIELGRVNALKLLQQTYRAFLYHSKWIYIYSSVLTFNVYLFVLPNLTTHYRRSMFHLDPKLDNKSLVYVKELGFKMVCPGNENLGFSFHFSEHLSTSSSSCQNGPCLITHSIP